MDIANILLVSHVNLCINFLLFLFFVCRFHFYHNTYKDQISFHQRIDRKNGEVCIKYCTIFTKALKGKLSFKMTGKVVWT